MALAFFFQCLSRTHRGSITRGARTVPCGACIEVILQTFSANLEATPSSQKPQKVHNTHVHQFFFGCAMSCVMFRSWQACLLQNSAPLSPFELIGAQGGPHTLPESTETLPPEASTTAQYLQGLQGQTICWGVIQIPDAVRTQCTCGARAPSHYCTKLIQHAVLTWGHFLGTARFLAGLWKLVYVAAWALVVVG